MKPYEGQLVFNNADGEMKYIPPVMPWRLQIAAQLGAGLISRDTLNVRLSDDELASMFLSLADALIKAHEETK